MSYFGNQGPAQDGGFIGGIARGNARLHNAKLTRARYSKSLGASLPDTQIDRDSYRWIPGMSEFPSDEILYNRTKSFTDNYDSTNQLRNAIEDGRQTPNEDTDAILAQYEKDRQLIAQWAESGPYMKETKAFVYGTAPLLLGIGLYATYRYFNNRPIRKVKGSKSALSAVFV